MNNQVFTYWENKLNSITPPFINLCLRSIQAQCKQLVILTPENLHEYLTENDLHPNWKNLQYIAHKADCIRVAVLQKFGGWWVDVDTVFIRPLDLLEEYIDDSKDFSYMQWDDGRVLNGFFYTKKNSNLMCNWLLQVNKILAGKKPETWNTFGEAILTPLVLWKYKEKCQKLDRHIFLPVNIDKIPNVFFEDINYRMFIKQNTVAVALNNSFMMNHYPSLQNQTTNELLAGSTVLNQIFRDAHFGYGLTPFDVGLQFICDKYSYGSISAGDVEIFTSFFTNLDLVVELGTNQGTTTLLLSQFNKKVVTVDVFEDFDKIEDPEWKQNYTIDYNNNSHSYDKICKLFGNKHNIEAIKGLSYVAAERFKDGEVQGIIFDADHSFNGLQKDFISWLPKVAIDGIMIFHDCNQQHNGVFTFYREVLLNCKEIEEIKFKPTTFYSSIAIFWRIK